MLRYSVPIVVAVWCLSCASCLNYGNNVCPTLQDYRTIFRNKNCSYNPNVGSSPRLIAKRNGYPFENHPVVTEDGYILNLHRIPRSRYDNSSSGGAKRRPILILHGLAGSSSFWVLQGKKSIAFFLADNGYDVWLGNLRGNAYSSKHVNRTVSNRDYWNFGFHEMAIYDLPACIDFIANRTGEKGNLIYVGHSMGTTISYIYSTLKREHALENLKAIISLAPVAYMENVGGTFRLLAPSTPLLSGILKKNGFYAIGERYQTALVSALCGKYPLILTCNFVVMLSSGLAIEQTQPALLPVFLSYYPSGTSIKTLEHFAQFIVSNGKFQWYDYGPKRNVEKYNKTTPPDYDVSQIPVPVHLFVGSEDILATLKDVKVLETKINTTNTIHTRKHVFPFAHNDFFLGRHLDPFHKELLEVIREY